MCERTLSARAPWYIAGLLDGLSLVAILLPTWGLLELAARAIGWW